MTTPTSQPPAGQGQTQTPVTPPAATEPQAATIPQSTPPVEPTPQYVTKADLDAAIASAISKAQSMDGKALNAVQKEIAKLKAAGIEATPDQVQKLMAAQQPDPGTAQTPAPDQTPAPVTPQANPQQTAPDAPDASSVTLKAYSMMAEAGVLISDSDPEAANIRQDVSAEEWLSDVQDAIKAKAERLQREGNPARMPNLAGGTPSGQPAHVGMSGADTLDSYFKSRPK